MSWTEDCISAENMAEEAVEELEKLDLNNPLLWWWRPTPEGTEDPFESEMDRNQKMKDKFWNRAEPWNKQPGAIVSAVVTTNFALKVREEIRRIKSEQV